VICAIVVMAIGLGCLGCLLRVNFKNRNPHGPLGKLGLTVSIRQVIAVVMGSTRAGYLHIVFL